MHLPEIKPQTFQTELSHFTDFNCRSVFIKSLPLNINEIKCIKRPSSYLLYAAST
jgi:hypothetical protein